MSEVNESVELFTVKLIRFERDGKKWATITLHDGSNDMFEHSYCDEREIIERAFYQAKQAVDSKISNAGMPESEVVKKS